MNKVIEWLFQRTTDGATYLQVIIIGLFLFILINVVFKSVEDVINCIKEKSERAEDNNV